MSGGRSPPVAAPGPPLTHTEMSKPTVDVKNKTKQVFKCEIFLIYFVIHKAMMHSCSLTIVIVK